MRKEIKPYIPPCEAPKIAIVTDAPSVQDLQLGKPLIDYRGQEFSRMFNEAGGTRSDCYITTVFKERPPEGDLFKWCGKKAEVDLASKQYNWTHYPFPPVSPGKYIHPEKCAYLFPLRNELAHLKPNVVIALGNYALWALCQTTGINKYRGTILESTLIPGLKVLPTYHPGAVIADWSKRVIVISDLMKAVRESAFAEIRRPARRIYIAESLSDIEDYIEEKLIPSEFFMVDIETVAHKFISCISFAPSPYEALVIPFIKYGPKYYKSRETDPTKINPWDKPSKLVTTWKSVGPNLFSVYWEDLNEEIKAWNLVRKIMSLPNPKGGQNFLYDAQYLLTYLVELRNVSMDTMILHHALYPELPKSLDFLGSIYTNEVAWKQMRPRGKGTEYKREE